MARPTAEHLTVTGALLHLGVMGNVHTSSCRACSAGEMDKILAQIHEG